MKRQYTVCHPVTLWAICSKNKWLTRGTREAFSRIIDANENGEPVEKIARMIFENSYTVSYDEVLKTLQLEQTNYLSECIKQMEEKQSVTRSWLVFGISWQPQEISYKPSFKQEQPNQNHPCIIECDCYDKTGTHDYVIIRITCETANECFRELWRQATSGIFAKVKIGRVVELV